MIVLFSPWFFLKPQIHWTVWISKWFNVSCGLELNVIVFFLPQNLHQPPSPKSWVEEFLQAFRITNTSSNVHLHIFVFYSVAQQDDKGFKPELFSCRNFRKERWLGSFKAIPLTCIKRGEKRAMRRLKPIKWNRDHITFISRITPRSHVSLAVVGQRVGKGVSYRYLFMSNKILNKDRKMSTINHYNNFLYFSVFWNSNFKMLRVPFFPPAPIYK